MGSEMCIRDRPLASRQLVAVPPILSCAAIYLRADARAAPGLAGATRPRRRGCDASERGGTNVETARAAPYSHTISPPHAPCSPSAGAVAWPPTSLPAPVRSYRTLSPLTCAAWAIGGFACCCRLASRRRCHRRAPACCFAGQPSACAGWESGSSSGASLQRRRATSMWAKYSTRPALPQTGVRLVARV